MSSLVFVRDAQGRPLMPMSAAYARTLIHQGKAHVWPHPAFPVIQLTRVVATPILRPVVVGFALNRTMVDLVVMIDQVRGSPLPMHMVVDLLSPPSLKQAHHRRKERDRRRRLSVYPGVFRHSHDLIHILMEVLHGWQLFVPISHLILLPSPRRTALPSPMTRWVEQRVTARLRRQAGRMSLIQGPVRGIAPEALRALVRFLTDSMALVNHQSPQCVACVVSERGRPDLKQFPTNPRPWMSQRRPTNAFIHATPEYAPQHHAQLCTVREQRHKLTGVVQALDLPHHIALRVPTHVDDHGVHWQTTEVLAHQSFHLWPITPVLILPLIRTRRAPPP